MSIQDGKSGLRPLVDRRADDQRHPGEIGSRSPKHEPSNFAKEQMRSQERTRGALTSLIEEAREPRDESRARLSPSPPDFAALKPKLYARISSSISLGNYHDFPERTTTMSSAASDRSATSESTAPTSPMSSGFQSVGDGSSRMTSQATSPNPSRKNTIDELSISYPGAGVEFKRAKTHHLRTNHLRLASDVLHPPRHQYTFPGAHAPRASWHFQMQAPQAMRTPIQRATLVSAPVATSFLPLLSDHVQPRMENFKISALDETRRDTGKAPAWRPEPIEPPCSYARDTTTPTSSDDPQETPKQSPWNGDEQPPSEKRTAESVECDDSPSREALDDEPYEAFIHKIHNVVMEYIPPDLIEDLEHPLKMVAVMCVERASNIIQARIDELSYHESAVDCSESLGPDGSLGGGSSSFRPQQDGRSGPGFPGQVPEDELDGGAGDDDDGVGQNRPPNDSLKRKQGPRAENEAKFPFSCPFRKRNPVRFNIRKHPSCSLQPHLGMTLLKRHVVHYHSKTRLDKICLRCKQGFDSMAALTAHSELLQGCQPRQDPPASDPEDRISDIADASLRSRKEQEGVQTWEKLWDVLFPMDDKSEPPNFESPVELDEVSHRFQQHRSSQILLNNLTLRIKNMHCQRQQPSEMTRETDNVCQGYIRATLDDCKTIPGNEYDHDRGPPGKRRGRTPKNSTNANARQIAPVRNRRQQTLVSAPRYADATSAMPDHSGSGLFRVPLPPIQPREDVHASPHPASMQIYFQQGVAYGAGPFNALYVNDHGQPTPTTVIGRSKSSSPHAQSTQRPGLQQIDSAISMRTSSDPQSPSIALLNDLLETGYAMGAAGYHDSTTLGNGAQTEVGIHQQAAHGGQQNGQQHDLSDGHCQVTSAVDSPEINHHAYQSFWPREAPSIGTGAGGHPGYQPTGTQQRHAAPNASQDIEGDYRSYGM